MTTVNRSAAPIRDKYYRIARTPHPSVRKFLASNYFGYSLACGPCPLLLPATTSVAIVLKLDDSDSTPRTLLDGNHAVYRAVPDATCRCNLVIWLSPLGTYRLLRKPTAEIRGELLDSSELLGSDIMRLRDRTAAASTWERRFALADEFLVRRLGDAPSPAPEVIYAWSRLAATDGRERIGRVASDVGWSHKHLITKFTQQVGLPPKTAARLIRFDRVLRRLRHRPARWDEIAIGCGYSDQPHLIREFIEFTGATPTSFATTTESVRGALVAGHDLGAGVVDSVVSAG
ncbi:helix-turn-helix domain-containing protein [Nocardia sp. CDC160]|uniref:helix-turn-helix domain-containing protein n=1 Tax=Nocardia sp. CDC160 TaxID=3112166 RepID=UPI002DB8F75B|nr:AraC family transcriptional regulator [Nocardia sp. CDC160]MEC3919406.1 AraC family transcriptional regulator [Nocardia sp. CDC160]